MNPIVGFSYQDVYYELPKIENSIALQLKDTLTKTFNINLLKTPLGGQLKFSFQVAEGRFQLGIIINI